MPTEFFPTDLARPGLLNTIDGKTCVRLTFTLSKQRVFSMKYGLNYQGSKNAIVESLCGFFPIKTNFYDLFAGGGAVTHRMLMLGQFKNYFMSDANPLPISLFGDCVKNNVPEPRWVSRDEFKANKHKDAYAACCYCFGGDWETYLYAKAKEPTQKAIHQALVYDDFSELDLFVDLSFLKDIKTWDERRLAMNRITPKALRPIELEHYVQLVGLSKVQAESLVIRHASYDAIEIEPDSVIYCDPPYRGTKKYQKEAFDHDAFYEWCLAQTELIFISEYTMPDEFASVGEFQRLEHKAAKCNSRVIERLFIPRHQLDMYDATKSTLF